MRNETATCPISAQSGSRTNEPDLALAGETVAAKPAKRGTGQAGLGHRGHLSGTLWVRAAIWMAGMADAQWQPAPTVLGSPQRLFTGHAQTSEIVACVIA